MEGSIGGGAKPFAEAIFGSVMSAEAQVAGVVLVLTCCAEGPSARVVESGFRWRELSP